MQTRTYRRYLTGAAAIALALGVAACNDEGSDADQTGAVPEEQMTPQDPAALPAEPMVPAPMDQAEPVQ